MKTLSDDITIKLPTTGMAEGYVITKIYANGIGVFTGRSYIQGVDSSLYVNVNDIAIQTRGKYDYLKLNDDGKVETVPLVNDIWGTYSYQRRWNIGQVGNYKVTITDNNNTYEDSEYVLTGYDYPNRDLKPTYMDEEDSSLCRIMQGCNWIYNHDEEIGDFLNLLLPHYPLVKTDKYGLGLQIGAGNVPLASSPNTPYSLRSVMGSEVELGSPIYGLSNTTFLTLNDLINGITGLDDNDSDVSIYLKQSETSGDEFGDWEEGYDIYRGHLSLQMLVVTGHKNGLTTYIGSYSYNSPEFADYANRYITETSVDWDLDALAAGQSEVYITNWYVNVNQVTEMIDLYKDNYGITTVPKVTPEEQEFDYIDVTPIYTNGTEIDYVPDKYIGKCTVAVLDSCYARYYLAWNDRYGDIMSQPFNGKIEYSEDFERNEIKDYKLRRRVIHNELQPKWKLNTKWLNEDIYPMYESIFTSPYLLLYDTKTDRSWNVILTDSEYKEKSFNTEKTLFNLEINVEANTKQNYIF